MKTVVEFLRFIRWPVTFGVAVSGGLWLGMWIGTLPEWLAIAFLLIVGIAAHFAIFVLVRGLQRERPKIHG